MRLAKRVFAAGGAAALTLSTVTAISFGGVALAASGSDTCTWTSTAATANFSTAANWSGCSGAAPVSGDNLVFNNTNFTADTTATNDISNLSIGSISFLGDNQQGNELELVGNPIALTGGISLTGTSYNDTISTPLVISGNQTFAINQAGLYVGTISGSGNVAVTNTSGSAGNGITFTDNSPNYSGTVTPDSQSVISMSADNTTFNFGGTIHIDNGAGLGLVNRANDNVTFAVPLTLGGDGAAQLSFKGNKGALNLSGNTGHTITLSSPITLTSDVQVTGYGALAVSGAISGGHTITPAAGEDVTINTGSGAQKSQVAITTLSDDQPSQSVGVASNNIVVLDGTRGEVYVYEGGILQGNGTAKLIEASKGSTVAPGHSPGKLTVLTTLTFHGGSTYQAQLKNKSAGSYDQLVVGSASDTTGNDIVLGDSTGAPILDTQLYDGYKIAAGDKFTIINNLSGTPVQGTFANLPEGATFKVGTGVFKISYIGGDGNDVVLTAVTAPTTPNTGFALVSAHPLAGLGATVVSALAIVGIAQRSRKQSARR